MRPGIARAFSATQRIGQQQLFEPYIPPLNQEQKKALRKIAKADEPHYHGHMSKDAVWLLAAYHRTDSQRILLKETLSRVKKIVHEHAGPHCTVEDISMHTYSSEIHNAPFEFAIVDKSRPDGVSPEEDPAKLPVVYDANRFSEILMKEGFTGGFWAPPWDMGKTHHYMSSEILYPPSVRDLTMPWPKHRRPFLREFHYPARLVTYSPVVFSLTLPGPSIMRLHNLLKSYFKLRPAMNGLLRMLFIWTRSHRMDELTTQCLALLVIRYMQETRKVPNLMDLNHTSLHKSHVRGITESKIWMPYQYLLPRVRGDTPRECRVVPTQLEHTIVDYNKFSLFDKKPGSQFWDFMSFWRNGLPIAKTYALSVGQNKYLKRQQPLLKSIQREQEIRSILKTSETTAKQEGFDPAATTYDPRWQPFSWPLQALVVQDPFIPTYNHAESVSRETFYSFVRHSQMTSRNLAFSWPFFTVFGENFVPSSEEKVRHFERRRAHGPSIGRGYHTDTARPTHSQITEPPNPVLQERAKTISRVQNIIRKKYGQSFTVKAFGSTEYGVSTSSSDLDLVVIDAKRMEGFSPNVELQRLPDIYNVLELSRVLRRCGLFTRIKAIPTATVPIVKFKDQANGINCDINVNEQLGLRNTGMIKRYCDIVPILRPMIAYIKRWAKPLGLNSPSMTDGPRSFSSYALTLMTISYLQIETDFVLLCFGRSKSQGLAPNLQSRIPRGSGNSTGFFWIRPKTGKSSRVDTRYHLGRGWTATETTSYEDALTGWFHYWGYEHGYSTMVASIREGGLIEKQPTLVQEPQPQMSLNDHPTQQLLVADGSVSEERFKAQDSSPPSTLPLAGHVPDAWPEYPDLNIDTSKSFDDMDDSLAKLARHPPQLPKRTPAWHTLPFCVKDPFIRNRIVTQAVGHKILEVFKNNCQRVALMLSHGASLDDLVKRKRKGKGPQKISKQTDAPGPDPYASLLPVVSEVQELRADFIPANDHEFLTPETRQRYPGAVALGPVEHASSVFEPDNQDDELDTEELEDPPHDFTPDYPIRTLPEFEEEGFGLKNKYFSVARSPDEDTEQPLEGSVGSERSEELEMGHTHPQGDQGAFAPPGEAEAPSTGSGGQLFLEQDSVGASGSGPAQ